MTTSSDPPPPAKKRGRPRERDGLSAYVTIRVSTREYDAVTERARLERVTLSEYLRRVIRDPAS